MRTPVPLRTLASWSMVELQERYRLHDRVALRPEPFGALAYHYGNRKLVFLKNQRIVDLVKNLDSHPSILAALDAHDVPERSRANYLAALESLIRSDMLVLTPEVL